MSRLGVPNGCKKSKYKYLSMFAKNLKSLRKITGITQSQLAIYLGLSKVTISSWEMDISRPNSDSLSRLVKLFDMTPKNIYGISLGGYASIILYGAKEKRKYDNLNEYIENVHKRGKKMAKKYSKENT